MFRFIFSIHARPVQSLIVLPWLCTHRIVGMFVVNGELMRMEKQANEQQQQQQQLRIEMRSEFKLFSSHFQLHHRVFISVSVGCLLCVVCLCFAIILPSSPISLSFLVDDIVWINCLLRTADDDSRHPKD